MHDQGRNEDNDDDTTSTSDVNVATTSNPDKSIHFYFVPRYRQVDPAPTEPITSQETLATHYRRLSFGTCIIAPRGGESFCKVTWIPFESMSADETQGWQKLVCHFLERTHYVNQVGVNGPQLGGVMWADGWRKSSTRAEAFGRYCSVEKLLKLMKLAQYNREDEAAAARETTKFLATCLKHISPGVFEAYRRTLIDNNLPSMGHMEYPSPYDPFDFASFLTFTMFDFYNGPHEDTDANHWTLVIWIPIFNPLTTTDTNPILADKDFDMLGGQFTFRDFQVYLDLKEVLGVTVCVFKSKEVTHQTLPGHSPSGKYTRIGFSCQMSEKMTEAVVAHLNRATSKKNRKVAKVAGQQKQIENAQRALQKKK